MCLKAVYGSAWKKKVSFSCWRVKTHGASMFWSLGNNTVNQQLPAQQRTGVAGIWNDKSCRQRLGNSFTYLQPHSHTTQRSWLGAAQCCPGSQPLLLALLRALQEREPRLGAGSWCRDAGPASEAGTEPSPWISSTFLNFQVHFTPQGILGKDIFPALIFVRHRSHCGWCFSNLQE